MLKDEIFLKKNLIDKYFHKLHYEKLFDILLKDIEGISLYIRLDYIKKNSTYRVSWVNLTAMNDNNIKYWVNSNLMYPSKFNNFKNIMIDNLDKEEIKDNDDINSNIIVTSYFNYVEKIYEFRRYIPKSHEFLADALYIIFDNMPRYLYTCFQIMVEKLVNPSLNIVFAFDMNKDNIDNLFDKVIIERGKKYFEEGKVLFIESEGNITYSVVRGKSDHLVNINYDDKKKELVMSCTCESNHFCKHIYASFLALKNKKVKKFYKIAYIDENMSMVDNIRNFSYLLCMGIIDDYLIVVDNQKFAFLPILDEGKIRFKIIEDDKNNTLENTLNEYLKDKLG